MEARDLVRLELPRRPAGMDPCSPQRLVGVDVPDPGDAALVEEEGLHGALRPSNERAEAAQR